ncbi:hypothetical protein [Varunaivibrio sulfuroxidans]|uniref:Dolichyl-phosphate-mannose-protein mannosyltransferase n=1 Tax=Varunaivibrio sulfuroxidans TaxID=1773489 RepID=A0A4R3JBG6_9PROT|nr:hypothetical protein [Varunaivibrio sulfuroxidans]TCS62974.1 hypothetical protein EDD55_10465 [Varunaivibrio sulfuroxidans]WES31948.1 hypothetical protein P3M64_06215 [Varunaivibrio sulfuroxidans]
MPTAKTFLKTALFIALFVTVALRVFLPNTAVSPDSHRYIAMGLNVAEYGTLSSRGYAPNTPPKPGFGAGGALTAFEIAAASLIDKTTHDSLACIATHPDASSCAVDIPALKVFYTLEIFIFHVAVFFIARLVFANDIKAALAVLLSLAFKDTRAYANTILSEPAYMMTAALFVLLWLYAWVRPERLKAWLWCGAALGLTVLVKPAWAALLPGLGVLAGVSLLRPAARRARAVRPAAVFVFGAVLVLAPLFVRNVIQLNHWGLSDPSYLGISLAHRAAYNAMTWAEWARGWLFYLPDFGDKAARALFGHAGVDRLAWGPDSYYVYGRDILHHHAVMASSPEGAGGYLLRHNFFNAPFKSAAVTALLAWRGVFVGNLMGLVGLVLAGPVLYFSNARVRRRILLIALPLTLMVSVHALVSVSIHRYNLALVIPYALIMAQFLYALLSALGRAFGGTLPQRLTATAATFLPKKG